MGEGQGAGGLLQRGAHQTSHRTVREERWYKVRVERWMPLIHCRRRPPQLTHLGAFPDSLNVMEVDGVVYMEQHKEVEEVRN